MGAFASRAYYLHRTQEQECNALSFAVLNSLPVISHLGSNDSAGAQRLVEINLPLQIESLREIAKGQGQSAQVAEETLRRVRSWRSEHPTLAITPRLQKAIEP